MYVVLTELSLVLLRNINYTYCENKGGVISVSAMRNIFMPKNVAW
jgi:hypothetical protein